MDRFLDLVQVRHGLDDDQVYTRASQRQDLLAEDLARLFWLDAAERRHAHPQRPDVPGDQNWFEGSRDDAPRQLDPGYIDLCQLVF